MRLLRSARAGIAVACASTLVSAPLLVPTTSTAAPARTEAAMQSISIKVAKKAINVRGAKGLHAGRIKVKVSGKGVAEILMFQDGYEFADFRKDVAASDKGDMKALKRAIARTTFVGGVQPGSSGTVVLPKAGDYTVFSFASRGHAEFRAAAKRQAKQPRVDGSIVGKTGPRWGGSSTLPAQGTFTFKNADSTTPHFVILQQVAEGTTTDQVLQALQSQQQGPPPDWFLSGSLETASLSPGRSMTVDYDLPAGQYVVMCFFPDPSMHGMPHALMGMLEMIHLT
jgi:hypothetical protein